MLPARVEIALKKIQDKAARRTPRKTIAMKGHSFGCCKFDLYVAIFQPNGVISGSGDLVPVVIMRGIARSRIVLGSWLQSEIPGIRHKEDVAEVRDAGAAEVILSKPYNDAVGIVITGAPVPAFIDIGGSDLHCAEWYAGPEKSMAVGGGADIRVDCGEKGAFGLDFCGRLGVEVYQEEGGEDGEDGLH